MSENDLNILAQKLDKSITKMTEPVRLILKYWYSKCKVYYKCHKESSDHYDKINKYLGVPAVIVGVFNTTTIFSNYTTQNNALTIISGTASFISTVLTVMQNYFELGKLSSIHSKLANGYNKITHLIEKILMYDRLTRRDEIDSKTIDNILNQMELLTQDSPVIPDVIWNKHKSELKQMVSIIVDKKGIASEFVEYLTKSNDSANSRDDEKVHPMPEKENKDSIEIVYDNSKQ